MWHSLVGVLTVQRAEGRRRGKRWPIPAHCNDCFGSPGISDMCAVVGMLCRVRQCCSNVILAPAASSSLGNLWEMQNLGLYSRPTWWETLGLGPNHVCFSRPSREFWCSLKLETCWRSYVHNLWCRAAWVTSCMTLVKTSNLYVSLFLHLQKRGNMRSTCLTGLLWRLNLWSAYGLYM